MTKLFNNGSLYVCGDSGIKTVEDTADIESDTDNQPAKTMDLSAIGL
jgi:hypothetical protein